MSYPALQYALGKRSKSANLVTKAIKTISYHSTKVPNARRI
jgi:hypothetical protein